MYKIAETNSDIFLDRLISCFQASPGLGTLHSNMNNDSQQYYIFSPDTLIRVCLRMGTLVPLRYSRYGDVRGLFERKIRMALYLPLLYYIQHGNILEHVIKRHDQIIRNEKQPVNIQWYIHLVISTLSRITQLIFPSFSNLVLYHSYKAQTFNQILHQFCFA